MELKELQKHILTLATLEETEAGVISCYLDLGAVLHPRTSHLWAALWEPTVRSGARSPLSGATASRFRSPARTT